MLSDKELIKAVQDAAGDEYKIYGELGRETDDRVALLALERAANALIVLIVTATPSPSGLELSVDMRRELDAGVPDAGAFCTNCGNRLRPWARFCGRCGTDATGRGGTGDTDVTQLRGAVEAAIAGDYDMLGEMHRKEGGGAVFFGRNRATGKIVALRLNKVLGTGEYELDETRVIKKLSGPAEEVSVSVSVTQVLRKLDSQPGAARSGASPAIDMPLAPRPSAPPPLPPPPRVVPRPDFDLDMPQAPQQRPRPDSRPTAQVGRESAQPLEVKAPRQPMDIGGAIKRNTSWLIGAGAVALLGALAWAALSL